MSTKRKEKWFADIDGKAWEVCFPFCAGCPELCIGLGCAYEGNGCRFPDKRVTRPTTTHKAYAILTAMYMEATGKDRASVDALVREREKGDEH